ncbi:MAG: hypothetical protein J4G13_02375 [Dehalococcoidia bacterium]|nr:hypothetical protein [Dehalococcoidia bacterium]
MATMIDGESYLGRVMVRPLSKSGDVTMYLWPLRCLKAKFGGPTFGVDVNGVEIIRFDPHGARGHWHKGGYDKLGAGGSHVDYPEGVSESASQMEFSLQVLREQTGAYLAEAGYPEAAANLDSELLQAASDAIVAHLQGEGDLISEAKAKDLIAA